MKPTPHKPACPVYQHAHALIGVDRRGMCKCGAEQANEERAKRIAVNKAIVAKGITDLPTIKQMYRDYGLRHRADRAGEPS